MQAYRRTRGTTLLRTRGTTLLALASLLGTPYHVAPLAGQQTTSEEEARAARLARADSIRATMEQPPGDRKGLTAMDVIRAPFQVVSGVLALTFSAGFLALEALDEIGVKDAAMDARAELSEGGLELSADFIGKRSGPAVVATYRGLDPFFAEAGYSFRRYQRYRAGLRFGNPEASGLEASGTFRDLRELHFWGVGPDSHRGARSDYAHEQWVGGAWGWTDFGGPVQLGAGAAWERNDVGPGFDDARPDVLRTFATNLPFGALGRTEFLRLDGRLDADFTRIVGLQPRGVRLLGGYQVFRGLDDTDADFQRLTGDLRGHVPVTARQALALRILAEDHLAEEGPGVPLTHLARLGDDRGLRGYTVSRFRDRALVAATAEWRYEVWWHPGNPDLRMEGFVFVDHGAVGPSLDALDSGDFLTTPGFGLRLTDMGRARAEGYVAFGGHKTRVDVSLGATF